jgi:hypothetical protein
MGNTVGDGTYSRGWEIQVGMDNIVEDGNTVGDGKYTLRWEKQSGIEKTVENGKCSWESV